MILILAGFYALIEWKGWRRWAFPLVVVGMNSIAVYVMSWTMADFFGDAIDRHFGRAISAVAGQTFQPVLHGFTNRPDLLAHPVLDVPAENLPEDLRDE